MSGQPAPAYRGRFAPTPSGPLHFGSLVAALGSFLDCLLHQGKWLVRIEDIDPPRVVPGSADAILRTLDAFGFEWVGPVVYQSQRMERYREALQHLKKQGLLYACTCSRKALSELARRGLDGPVYPGHCQGNPPEMGTGALRFRVDDTRIVYEDAWQGRVACDLRRESGDFVVCRADGVISYQLAVVVDDAEQGITHVVRGADLLTSTPRQIALQQALGLPTPAYLHLPVALDCHGDKLSKQTLATPVDSRSPLPALHAALDFLGAHRGETAGSLTEFWSMAAECWPPRRTAPVRGMRPAQREAC